MVYLSGCFALTFRQALFSKIEIIYHSTGVHRTHACWNPRIVLSQLAPHWFLYSWFCASLDITIGESWSCPPWESWPLHPGEIAITVQLVLLPPRSKSWAFCWLTLISTPSMKGLAWWNDNIMISMIQEKQQAIWQEFWWWSSDDGVQEALNQTNYSLQWKFCRWGWLYKSVYCMTYHSTQCY